MILVHLKLLRLNMNYQEGKAVHDLAITILLIYCLPLNPPF